MKCRARCFFQGISCRRNRFRMLFILLLVLCFVKRLGLPQEMFGFRQRARFAAASSTPRSCTRRFSPNDVRGVSSSRGGLYGRRKQTQRARSFSKVANNGWPPATSHTSGELFLSVARRASLAVCCARPRRRRRRRRRLRRRRSAVRPPPTSTANQDVARPVTVIGARAMVR